MTKTVRTEYLDIAYEEAGETGGPVVVLVHGWPDDAGCWRDVIPALESRYRLVVPHLRGHGETRFRSAETMRSGQTAALSDDLVRFVEALELGPVVVAGHDWGARAGYGAAALRPDVVRALIAMSAGYASSGPTAPLAYDLAEAYWYEWFVATDRGRRAFDEDRREICRYLWRKWSPGWEFTETEFARTARAWDNADWPLITAHAYLQRWGEQPGAPEYQQLEERLAIHPPIRVPTLVLHGLDDMDNLCRTTENQARYFEAGYRRELLAGVGHFVPREAPGTTAAAIEKFVAGLSTGPPTPSV
ncbi:alpha/beta fold hydrolase [Mycolicibacterium mageritense]|uniref:Epoxide hydrolase A n=1 Tax=Mycolicibacterium mageritense TaxID=53462 RepID=A0AAI8TZS1_MYCME|nr:alpha/beta hydrolase [Mycolicibacterium mageritense]BDY31562.1 Epoxide hydrolase A [Mycolicibacterium mageritense]